MGNQCLSQSRTEEALNSASYFWSSPSIKKLGKRQSPPKSYYVGTMYRGKKSIMTEEELWAVRKIIKAFRNYKAKKAQSPL